MDGQGSLFGGEAPSEPKDRLFFSIFPDAHAAQRIELLGEDLRRRIGLTGSLLKTDRFHVTMNHLGDHVGVRQDIVVAAQQAASTLDQKSFDVRFDRVASFAGRPGKHPLVLRGGDGLADLLKFQQALTVAMARAGLEKWVEPRFTPHVTLTYARQAFAEQEVDPICWTVRELVLVHSLLGQTTYVALGRWQLA